MEVHTVGISDLYVSSEAGSVLVTHALGSCIALTIYDPLTRVGGLLHYMLPEAQMDVDKAARRPCMFADTGIPLLFRSAYQLGAVKSRLLVAAFGGAHVNASGEGFEIGRRNYLAMQQVLGRAGVRVHKEDVGGTSPRTVRMEITTGHISVLCGRQQREWMQPAQEARQIRHGT